MRSGLDLSEVIDLVNYPIMEPSGIALRTCVERIREDLKRDGCSILRGFIRSTARQRLERESTDVAPLGYSGGETVNSYNIALDAGLPEGHPAHIRFARGNAFVARDQIPETHLIQQLYVSPALQGFIAACFGVRAVYPMADGLAGLVVNVLRPGCQHPWHFDTNAFTVSLLTQSPESGGAFEYASDIRSPDNENLDAVKAVITSSGQIAVKRVELRCGDLQLFKGRFSLHRVTPVHGSRERLAAIFAFCEQPGVIGSVQRTRQLFGRLLPMHEKTARSVVRGDALLD